MENCITVTLPTALVRLFPGAANAMELRASTVREVIDQLNAGWPGMRDRLIDSRRAIRRHINIYVAGKKASLKTPLQPGARATILTAMSGG